MPSGIHQLKDSAMPAENNGKLSPEPLQTHTTFPEGTTVLPLHPGWEYEDTGWPAKLLSSVSHSPARTSETSPPRAGARSNPRLPVKKQTDACIPLLPVPYIRFRQQGNAITGCTDFRYRIKG